MTEEIPNENEIAYYHRVLELRSGATAAEIRKAYMHLKALYSGESIATSTLMEEYSDERRAEILREIEEAYKVLHTVMENPSQIRIWEKAAGSASPLEPDAVRDEISGVAFFSGAALRTIREKLGVELSEISLATKIRTVILDSLEREDFDALPEEVYVRGFLGLYLKYLAIGPERVVRDYMSRYSEWQARKNPPIQPMK